MCGISGYLNLEAGVRTDVLRQMNNVIAHRGPEDEGYALIGRDGIAYYSGRDTVSAISLPPLESADGRRSFLGFGHRRLSILDLSPSGHQPMGLSQRKISVVYNGEIYNFIELREELSALGYQFHTTCDTEILLNAYCEWGEDCLEHFNGMWSFALWDGVKNRLFCARDRLGAKPFHYCREGNLFLFGSELKQLCQTDEVDRRFDRSYLAASLMYRLNDYNDQTLIEKVKVLQPGHKLTIQLSGDCSAIESMHIQPYWELKVDYRYDVSEEEWKRRVAQEITRSCSWRMRSDAPVAALLSGGLDSSCMVTEMCAQMADPSKLETFTTSYSDYPEFDEWKFADMVNKACGCRGNLVTPDPHEGIEQQFEELVWHTEGYTPVAFLGGRILFEEIRRRGYKVILNGQCGDETMFGYQKYYAHYFSDLLRRGKLGTAIREYPLCAKNSAMSFSYLFQTIAYFSTPIVRDTRQQLRAGRFVQHDLLDARNREELHRLLYPRSLEELQRLELTATGLPQIVRNDDRMYMASSIESRIPFMDYRYVELAMQIPASMKIRGGYTKSIVREAFDSRMPKEVTWRTNKMGFPAPAAAWQQRFHKEYLTDYVQNAKTAPYFKKDALQKMVDTDLTDKSLFEFLTMEIFARKFGVGC